MGVGKVKPRPQGRGFSAKRIPPPAIPPVDGRTAPPGEVVGCEAGIPQRFSIPGMFLRHTGDKIGEKENLSMQKDFALGAKFLCRGN